MKKKRLSRNQQLALERTLLARERTMLAYFRTAFASLIFGAAIIKLFQSAFAYYIGLGGIILGIIFFVIGFHYFPSKKY